jgi:hypothetical protein
MSLGNIHIFCWRGELGLRTYPLQQLALSDCLVLCLICISFLVQMVGPLAPSQSMYLEQVHLAYTCLQMIPVLSCG